MIENTHLLKSFQLKVTPQRVAIVEALAHSGHLSIDELYQVLLEKFPAISLATIYKNINAMVEKQFVFEVKIPQSKSKYELSKAHHSHVVCNTCHKVEDVIVDADDVIQNIKQASHYQIKESALVFMGQCPECQSKASA